MSHYAIGDIQGCYDELLALLDAIQFDPKKDQLWLVGDLVNRGPKSLETLRFVKGLGNAAISVLGNHDLHLLAVYYGAEKTEHGDTLQDILNTPDAKELIDWLKSRPLLHHDAKLNFLMVHAGVAPQWSLEQAKNYAHEVEAALQGSNITEFLKHMYGNHPDTWQDNLTGWERLRAITNYFTRLRFCNEIGKMDFTHKGDKAPEGFYPWFKLPRLIHQRIVYGHWAALKGEAEAPNVFAIDTGCVWGESLTALRLEDLARFSVPSLQNPS
ncbi:MAG: hypothetical protein K0R66_933 [Gammaproteobacteria bacterium]|jgi:bis(5'-nucleosyl)-tetraphosphatase (symmetrical)|nr:hypothetical protein [Gammaproteobacteria bacterium]